MTISYDVIFNSETIDTLVTSNPSEVNTWVYQIQNLIYHNGVIGLDIEWRPSFSRYNNPVATLQLCGGNRCLIFQILHAPSIPYSLKNFLSNNTYTFVGVGIEGDVQKLIRDYDLVVCNSVDLGELAAERRGNWRLNNVGLKELARQILGVEIDKPRNITLSRWDNMDLTTQQVKYACLDAFISFEIGYALNASNE